ncbi:hypothetical protein [Nannocystis punicea]|uniref:Uncharacterized protein n=1 Tax=Nannocystis punicea TaxID=2995304 RepID=A0ABY7HDX5_9BACT|nr:hypothetical protein [Nannocystis poenicansa]WAS97285.1 hypothetical protein O0S08_14145 [Nannocystis poenicansa]
MPTLRLRLVLPLALFACTDRPLGETDGSTAGPSTGDSPPATGTTPDTATTPTTTAAPSTTATTGDPTATDGSSTTEIDPSVATTTPDPLPKLDFFLPGPTSGLMGCTLDAPAGTMVSGSSSIGPFMAQRAYFGVVDFDSNLFSPRIMLVSPTADPEVALELQNSSSGPIYYGDIHTDSFWESGWIGNWPIDANHYADGLTGVIARPDGAVIEAQAGNWVMHDPADPPRLVGSLQGEIAGPFDAVYCDKLDISVISE